MANIHWLTRTVAAGRLSPNPLWPSAEAAKIYWHTYRLASNVIDFQIFQIIAILYGSIVHSNELHYNLLISHTSLRIYFRPR